MFIVIYFSLVFLWISLFSEELKEEESKLPASTIICTNFIPQKPERFFLKKEEAKEKVKLEDESFFQMKRGKRCKKIIGTMQKCSCEECRELDEHFPKRN